MKAIVAVDSKWGIGCKGKLLHSIPEDMKFFKETTLGKVVVMGRQTFDSIPGKSPLKDRVNIVLTRNKAFDDSRLIICHSVEETLEELKKYNSDDIYIIGGADIYNEFLPYCNELLITKIQKEYDADKFFPDIDKLNEWKIDYVSEIKEYNGIHFTFNTYKRV